MKLNNEFKEIKNDEYIKKIDGSGLDKITNEFFSLTKLCCHTHCITNCVTNYTIHKF